MELVVVVVVQVIVVMGFFPQTTTCISYSALYRIHVTYVTVVCSNRLTYRHSHSAAHPIHNHRNLKLRSQYDTLVAMSLTHPLFQAPTQWSATRPTAYTHTWEATYPRSASCDTTLRSDARRTHARLATRPNTRGWNHMNVQIARLRGAHWGQSICYRS